MMGIFSSSKSTDAARARVEARTDAARARVEARTKAAQARVEENNSNNKKNGK